MLDYWEVVPEEAKAMLIIGFLFLLVCSVNLIGILLSKFMARAPEVGVRRALGASKARIFVQHLLECELIGLLGGAGAILAGLVGFRLLMSSLPITPGDAATLHIDRGFLLVTLALGVGTGALVGLAAALGSPARSPRQGGGLAGRGASRSSSYAQNALVVSQVALTVLIVAGAGVMKLGAK